MELDKIIKILANESRIFHSFSEEEVLRLLKCCTRKSFKSGEEVKEVVEVFGTGRIEVWVDGNLYKAYDV